MSENHPASRTLISSFMEKLGHKLPTTPDPGLMTNELRIAWSKIFLEEALELVGGLGVRIFMPYEGEFVLDPEYLKTRSDGTANVEFQISNPLDMVELADGIADSIFVASAISLMCGMNPDPLLREVCLNNLQKFGPGHSFKDGKLVKPPGHPKPDIVGVLKQQGLTDPTAVKPTHKMELTQQEFDTILAALRFYQAVALKHPSDLVDRMTLETDVRLIATDHGAALDGKGVDELAEKINSNP